MADINLTFDSDDLEQLKKLIAQLNKEIQKLKKFDVVGDDDVVRAKKQSAELLKATNELKRQELIAQRQANAQDKLNQKQQASRGIIGGLKQEVRDLGRALDGATDPKDIERLNRELKETRKRLSDAKGTTASWAKALGSFQFKFNALGNIASEVVSRISMGMKTFINDSIRMSAELQGVSNAFKKIGSPQLLNQLRTATRGAVSDMELMRAAVQASNFKIPLKELGTFLQFAGNRALETGEDFGFLVESIVKGLGRKSVLILDNLGLSVSEINEEVKKTGDFMAGAAAVIEREMAKSGEVFDTAKTEADKLKVSIDNLKLAFGNLFTETGFASDVFGFLADAANQAANYELNLIRISKMNAEQRTRLFDVTSRFNNKTGQQLRELIEDYQQYGIAAAMASEKSIRARLKEMGFTRKHGDLFYEELIKRIEEYATATVTSADKEIETTEDVIDKEKIRIEKLHERLQLRREDRAAQEAVAKTQKEASDELILNTESEIDAILEGQEAFITSEEKKTEVKAEEIRKRKELDDKAEADILAAEERKRAIQFETLNQLANLTQSLGAIQQTQKENELSAAGDNAQKRLEIEKKYAKKQQDIAVANAIINAAQGALKTYYQFGFPLAIPFIAAGGAAAAIEIAAIKRQKFAKGGEVGGRLHSQGGTVIEAEKGEYVINRRSTSKYKDLIEGINENDQLKIMMSLDKDRRVRSPQRDPYTRKMYELMREQETGYETKEFYVIKKGNTKTMIHK